MLIFLVSAYDSSAYPHNMYVAVVMHTRNIIITKILSGILQCIQWGNHAYVILQLVMLTF